MRGLKNTFNDFCESTTVHGLAYLTKKQHQSTKTIWFVIVLSAFIVATLFVWKLSMDITQSLQAQQLRQEIYMIMPFLP